LWEDGLASLRAASLLPAASLHTFEYLQRGTGVLVTYGGNRPQSEGAIMNHDLIALFEHPEWQKPLFAALDAQDVRCQARRQ
jgi:hypothetical protein